MNDWDIPHTQGELIAEINSLEEKARMLKNRGGEHEVRMCRLYMDLAAHRRRLLQGLLANSSEPPSGHSVNRVAKGR